MLLGASFQKIFATGRCIWWMSIAEITSRSGRRRDRLLPVLAARSRQAASDRNRRKTDIRLPFEGVREVGGDEAINALKDREIPVQYFLKRS